MFLVLSLLPLLVVSGFTFWQSQQALETRITAELTRLAQIQTQRIEDWLSERLNDVQEIAANDEMRSMDPSRIRQSIQSYMESGRYVAMFVAGTDGKTLVTDDGQARNLEDREYYHQALQGQANIWTCSLLKGKAW